MNQSHPKVSVIVVTHNSAATVQKSLMALRRASGFDRCELLVVDNDSGDGSVEIVRRAVPSSVIIELDENVGFAAACNLAAEKARGAFLLFHNPDLEIDPDAVDQLIGAHDNVETPGALAGRMRFPDGSFQPTCRHLPTVKNILLSRGSMLSRIISRSESYTLPDYEDVTEVPAVAETLLLIDRELFISIGMFDPRFFMYMEDSDLCLRLGKHGLRNYFVPRAGGVHLWGKGSTAGRLRRNCYHHVSVWKYFLKHFPNGFSVVILPVMLVVNLLLRSVADQFGKQSVKNVCL